jgi:hypothetical protein
MNDEQLTELIIKLSSGIAELNANMKTTLDKIAQHESRLTTLEIKGNSNTDWKVQLLMLLAKALLIGAVSIGSLVGAGNLLKNVLTPPSTPTLTTQSTTL